MMEAEIRSRLRALATAAADPLAPRFGRVLTGHLAPFDAFAMRGTPWSVIARICAEEGVVGPGGGPPDPRVLAAQVWRARQSRERTGNVLDRLTTRHPSNGPLVPPPPAASIHAPRRAGTARVPQGFEPLSQGSRDAETLIERARNLGRETE